MEPQRPWEPEPPPSADDDRHSIRVVVTDDLHRWRLTVFFRWILALPLIIWFFIWSIGAFFISIVNWLVTLISGRSPDSLHDFYASYVRFATHLHAYILLAANPYPGFTGKPGYPVDVEIDPPREQNRWKTLLRLLLALPALLLAAVFVGSPAGGGSSGSSARSDGTSDYAWYDFSFGSALFAVSILAWFACLARGRMPRGMRDLMAYGLRYAAQAWGYLFLLTDRYPNADPAEPPALPPEKPRAVRLVLDDDLRRSRLTVFFRFLLFLPHLAWLVLWSVLAWLAAIANWFATLALGRSPSALHRFLAAYVRYTTHVYAYLYLVANPFPGFVGAAGTYPIDLEIDGPAPQHRLKTLGRLFLAVPAFIIYFGLSTALGLVAFFGWFVALALGRMPQGLRNLGAWALRYGGEVDGYFYLLTDTYPYSGPWEFAPPVAAPSEPEPEPEAAFA
jgi:Domain of unknown function (DUF4389)